jgi:hypothetical protein
MPFPLDFRLAAALSARSAALFLSGDLATLIVEQNAGLSDTDNAGCMPPRAMQFNNRKWRDR